MFLDQQNIFDTPRLRYYKLKEEFERRYLNPKAWDHACDTKEIIQAYHDLLEFLEKTESFRNLSRSLRDDIPIDNIHLVLEDLPLPSKRREELIEYVIDGNPSHTDQLLRIKEFFVMKKKGSLVGL